MTEKDYSGATTSKIGKNAKANASSSNNINSSIIKNENKNKISKISKGDSNTSYDNYIKAGQIASKVKTFAKVLIKPEMPLKEIAEQIEAKIHELGGELAFPVNLSIDDVAAHFSPKLRDELKATGLLKVDFGVQIQGCICDIAFALDLTKDKIHEKLILAPEKALKAALDLIKQKKEKTTLAEIGKTIQQEIEKAGFIPIVNLSGHSLDEFNVHSGLTIPNYNNSSNKELGEGAFAIEPFATLKNGSGMIYDSSGGNIYHLIRFSNTRDLKAREILDWIVENKKSLPFSSRELERIFGTKALIAISNLKREGLIEEYSQLLEKSHQPVSQAETSLLIHEGKVEILCD